MRLRFLCSLLFQCLHIRIHDAEGVAALFLGVGFLQLHKVTPADVPRVGVAQVGPEEVQGQRVAFHILHQRLEFLLRAIYPERPEQRHAGFLGQPRKRLLRRGGLPVGTQVRDGIPGSDNAQALAVGG